MKYTKKQITKGFKDWQTDVRLNPSKFITDEEVLNTDVKEYAENQLDCLIKYINK